MTNFKIFYFYLPSKCDSLGKVILIYIKKHFVNVNIKMEPKKLHEENNINITY